MSGRVRVVNCQIPTVRDSFEIRRSETSNVRSGGFQNSQMQPNKLFVANISFEATEETIRALFEEVGTVEDIYYARDHESGRPRGFAFVTMATEDEAQQAIERLHGHILNERDLRVSIARPREERSGGGGEGRGGFRSGPRAAPRLNPGGGRGGFGGREGGFGGGGRGGYGGGGRGGYSGGRGGREGGFGDRRPRRDSDGGSRRSYDD